MGPGSTAYSQYLRPNFMTGIRSMCIRLIIHHAYYLQLCVWLYMEPEKSDTFSFFCLYLRLTHLQAYCSYCLAHT